MGDSTKRVLAMYDIRGKQEFIYKCNRLREIVGASSIIRDCFKDYLYPAAEKVAGNSLGIFHSEEGMEVAAFTEETAEEHFTEGYIGEVVYEGGGNFLVLFRNEETFRQVTYEFTKSVMEHIGTLRILGTCVAIDGYEDFKGDRSRLYEKHRINEGKESNIAPWATLPIVQVDRRTSMPLVDTIVVKNMDVQVSKESKAKYEKYQRELELNAAGELVLDNIVRKKGEDSLLAVVYIDGNNMGAAVEACCANMSSYKECVQALRGFSKEIQKVFIDDRMVEIDAVLAEKHKKDAKNNGANRRLVIGAGDEVNIICNAHDAFDCVKTYLKGLPAEYSACAGIAIFHSHAPYADVYRIAEECCEAGKDRMKALQVKNACLMDFHYCRGAIGVSLEEIRVAEGETSLSRPWLVRVGKDEAEKMVQDVDLDQIENMVKKLRLFERSNVKGLLEVAKKGEVYLELELARIKAHMSEEKRKQVKFDELEQMDAGKKCKLIYDLVSVYDIWFA